MPCLCVDTLSWALCLRALQLRSSHRQRQTASLYTFEVSFSVPVVVYLCHTSMSHLMTALRLPYDTAHGYVLQRTPSSPSFILFSVCQTSTAFFKHHHQTENIIIDIITNITPQEPPQLNNSINHVPKLHNSNSNSNGSNKQKQRGVVLDPTQWVDEHSTP